jgi:dTDP-4-amino-4,6-dideoxygalactose transaminase
LAKARTILDRRAQVARDYGAALTGLPWLIPPRVPDGCTHSFQSYVCRIREQGIQGDLQAAHGFRNRLMRCLETAGVSVRQGTHAVHGLEYYRKKYKLRVEDYPAAWAADRLTLTLPLFAQMTEEDVNYVVEKIRTCAASLA